MRQSEHKSQNKILSNNNFKLEAKAVLEIDHFRIISRYKVVGLFVS